MVHFTQEDEDSIFYKASDLIQHEFLENIPGGLLLKVSLVYIFPQGITNPDKEKTNIIYATYNIYHNGIDVYTHAGLCRCGWMRKTILSCDKFNSPEFGGIKLLQNLCCLFFQN